MGILEDQGWIEMTEPLQLDLKLANIQLKRHMAISLRNFLRGEPSIIKTPYRFNLELSRLLVEDVLVERLGDINESRLLLDKLTEGMRYQITKTENDTWSMDYNGQKLKHKGILVEVDSLDKLFLITAITIYTNRNYRVRNT